jgi:hypothetical protein
MAQWTVRSAVMESCRTFPRSVRIGWPPGMADTGSPLIMAMTSCRSVIACCSCVIPVAGVIVQAPTCGTAVFTRVRAVTLPRTAARNCVSWPCSDDDAAGDAGPGGVEVLASFWSWLVPAAAPVLWCSST